MRISDWSSDVCSSDLRRPRTTAGRPFLPPSRASSGRAAAPPRPSPIAAFRGATASCEGSCPEPGGKPLGSAQRQRENGERRVLVRARGEDGAIHQHQIADLPRSEEHTSELQSLMRISYAVFCLKKKKKKI